MIRTVENQRKNQDRPKHCIVDISQNTERGPEDQMRLAVTPEKDY